MTKCGSWDISVAYRVGREPKHLLSMETGEEDGTHGQGLFWDWSCTWRSVRQVTVEIKCIPSTSDVHFYNLLRPSSQRSRCTEGLQVLFGPIHPLCAELFCFHLGIWVRMMNRPMPRLCELHLPMRRCFQPVLFPLRFASRSDMRGPALYRNSQVALTQWLFKVFFLNHEIPEIIQQ